MAVDSRSRWAGWMAAIAKLLVPVTIAVERSVSLVNTKEVFGDHVESLVPCGVPPQ